MKNKFISVLLVFAAVTASVLSLTGCGDDNYPVDVANFVIENEPENIVILDAPTADIVSYTGYDKKMVGKSDEVDQEWLEVVPSFGSAQNPDIEKIKSSETDIVFAGDSLSDESKAELESNNIKVITMAQAQTAKQLETSYITLGKILGGKVTGSNAAAEAYSDLLDEMDMMKSYVTSSKTSDVLDTVCYLFVENGKLRMMSSGTYGDLLLSYTGAVNAAVNIEDNLVDVNTLKIANPNFIFYADDETYSKIKSDPVLGALTAVKTKKMLMVSAEEMNRQGQTAINTLKKMIYFMYPGLAQRENASTPDLSAAETTQPQSIAGTSPVSGTTAPLNTVPSDSATSVASEYKITITPNLSLKIEDENNNVKVMQQRLYDLGYITDKGNITGYFGEISQNAVKEFQKKNSIKETGAADNATLVAMFDVNAVKAK